jgi:hypothetical protein
MESAAARRAADELSSQTLPGRFHIRMPLAFVNARRWSVNSSTASGGDGAPEFTLEMPATDDREGGLYFTTDGSAELGKLQKPRNACS